MENFITSQILLNRMKKNLKIVLIVVIVIPLGATIFLAIDNYNSKQELLLTEQKLNETELILKHSTTHCETDDQCMALILDRDQCISIPMSTLNKGFFEISYTDWGGCDALVMEHPTPVCRKNRCVFTESEKY